MFIALVSLVVAALALVINVARIVRRPRIRAEWGYVVDDPPMEGVAVIATARHRPIEVDGIGIVLIPGGTRRRKLPEWIHESVPFRYELAVRAPARIEDGQSIRAFGDLDSVIDQIDGRSGTPYVYVLASGTAYLAKEWSLRRVLLKRRLRQGGVWQRLARWPSKDPEDYRRRFKPRWPSKDPRDYR